MDKTFVEQKPKCETWNTKFLSTWSPPEPRTTVTSEARFVTNAGPEHLLGDMYFVDGVPPKALVRKEPRFKLGNNLNSRTMDGIVCANEVGIGCAPSSFGLWCQPCCPAPPAASTFVSWERETAAATPSSSLQTSCQSTGPLTSDWKLILQLIFYLHQIGRYGKASMTWYY